MVNDGGSQNVFQKEVELLLGSNILSSDALSDLANLDLFDHHACEECLNNINDTLAEISLMLASEFKLEITELAITRISPAVDKFLKENADNLQNIDLSGNNILDLAPLLKIKFPNLQSVNLNNNPLSEQKIVALKLSMPTAYVSCENMKEVSLPAKKELPKHKNVQKKPTSDFPDEQKKHSVRKPR